MTTAPPPGPSTARPAPLLALADRCVQCGLCLPVCPTYARGRIEAEGPRGRIALIRAWALEAAAPTATGDAHLDHCLGCRRCETACPANVRYGELLVQARERQRARRGSGRLQRTVEALVARPTLLRIGLSVYRVLYPLLPPGLRPLPRPPRKRAIRAVTPATTDRTVAVFRGCVADTYEAPLRDAMARLFAAAGIVCVEPAGQACCGAIHAHAGDTATAARMAARARHAFEGHDAVLVPATGCHGTLAQALGEGRTVDPATLLDDVATRLHFRPANERVALHLPCTQRSVVRSDGALRRLLGRVPALEVVELGDGYGCCGAAGSHLLTDATEAAAYREPLLAQAKASGASRILSANIGCRLHMANGTGLTVEHPLEFLARHLE